MDKKTVLIVRLDDVCATMNFNSFDRVMTLLESHAVAPLLGVVPFCADPKLMVFEADSDFYDKLLNYQNKNCVIALHGYDHVYKNKNGGVLSINKKSEMCGESFEFQKAKIKEGLDFLNGKGLNVNCYMAPSHSFDKNTVKAVKECGIDFITDGYTENPFNYLGVTFLPCKDACSVSDSAKGLRTLCIHCNTLTEEGFVALEKTLDVYHDNFKSFYEVMTPSTQTHFKAEQNRRLFVFKIRRILSAVKRNLLHKK